MKAVIMAGGKGTRFWPRSVASKPKQFQALTSHQTMLQLTYDRFLQWLPPSSIYIVTTEMYSGLVREQLPCLSDDHLLLEPDQRDTGPCIALTAVHFLKLEDDEVLVTVPSDQYIPDGAGLRNALLKAEETAKSDKAIVTLGIVPNRAETGYGYMKAMKNDRADGVLAIKSFIEKPSAEKAANLIEDRNVFWNSGIFVWRPSTIGYYMKIYQPQLWDLIIQYEGSLAEAYASIPSISVDYAIMEKADTILMIPVDFEWDDVGAWTSLERMHGTDGQGNIVFGSVLTEACKNSIIYTENVKTLIIGVEDLIVISTDEGLLVCHKSAEQRIKQALLKLENR